jgi:ribonuclease HI
MTVANNPFEDSSQADKAREWPLGRKFNPKEIYGDDIDLDIVECPRNGWVFVACEHGEVCPHCHNLPAHTDCVVIAVDDACRHNGTSRAEAAIGIYSGKDSSYNRSIPLNIDQPTNQVAELTAGLFSLKTAMVIAESSLPPAEDGEKQKLCMVVIKSDSEYLVKGMTEWILKWKENGYRNVKGRSVVNSALFQELEEAYQELVGRGIYMFRGN